MCMDPMTLLMIGGTIMGGVGQLQAANAQAEAMRYNAKVSEMNAKTADKRAKDALERGKIEEQSKRASNQQLLGQQQAAMAANGVDLTFGSPLDLLVDTAVVGELDALTIRSNTYREERDIRQQAANYRSQAGMQRAEANSAQIGGFIGAAGTVLTGGANAYSSYNKIGAYA